MPSAAGPPLTRTLAPYRFAMLVHHVDQLRALPVSLSRTWIRRSPPFSRASTRASCAARPSAFGVGDRVLERQRERGEHRARSPAASARRSARRCAARRAPGPSCGCGSPCHSTHAEEIAACTVRVLVDVHPRDPRIGALTTRMPSSSWSSRAERARDAARRHPPCRRETPTSRRRPCPAGAAREESCRPARSMTGRGDLDHVDFLLPLAVAAGPVAGELVGDAAAARAALQRPLQRFFLGFRRRNRSRRTSASARRSRGTRPGRRDRTSPTGRSARRARSSPPPSRPDGSRRRRTWSRGSPPCTPASGGGGWRWRR